MRDLTRWSCSARCTYFGLTFVYVRLEFGTHFLPPLFTYNSQLTFAFLFVLNLSLLVQKYFLRLCQQTQYVHRRLVRIVS